MSRLRWKKEFLIDLKKILKKFFEKRNFYVIIEYVNLVVKSGKIYNTSNIDFDDIAEQMIELGI